MGPEQADVQKWCETFGHACKGVPGLVPPQVAYLRVKLLAEELQETVDAIKDGDMIEIADGLADLMVIIYGTASVYGINLQPVFAEVMRSNWAKLGPEGKVLRRDDGKIMKPDGWKPPNVHMELVKQGWSSLTIVNGRPKP